MYKKLIIGSTKCPVNDARLIEAYMLCELGTLDSISKAEFKAVALECYAMVKADIKQAEKLAQSYGL